MRKILTKIVTLIVIVALSVSTFVGCGLITTNTDRDMAQEVATVKIAEGVDAETIYKRELISAYMSYGYYYVQYYGYTQEAAYELILDNLVQNRIIIQQSRLHLADLYNGILADSSKANTEFLQYFADNASANGAQINAKVGDLETLAKYLTEYELAQSLYNVKVTVNGLIDAYEEEDEDEDEKEDETFEVRAVPTKESEEADYEYELKDITPEDYEYKKADVVLKTNDIEGLKVSYPNEYDLNLAVYNAYEIDLSTSSRVKALNKAIKDLKDNGLIKSNESQNVRENPNNVLEYSYFKDALKSQYESVIVTKYEDSLVTDVESKLTDAILFDQYQAEYKAQEINYQNGVTAYESALDAATKDSFVVCNPYDGYGYVLNLLVGFSTEQSATLSAESSKTGATKESIKAVRDDLLSKLVAKDQRETWVYSSYGEYENNSFVFDDEYLLSQDSKAKLGSFIGKVYGASSTTDENEDGVEETTWTFTNVIADTIPFNTLLSDYINPLMGMEVEADVAKQISWSQEKRDVFDDLIYAFSTDPGSLGSYLGYAYSPVNASSTYVKEFADASSKVVEMGEGAYILVATDYGYHLIVCTKKIAKGADVYADLASFSAALTNEESLASKYKEVKLNGIVETEVGKIADKLINDYIDDEDKVTYNYGAYKDLIPSAGEKTDEE